MGSAELAALLDQGLLPEPEHRNGLSIHLPMALVALKGLGTAPRWPAAVSWAVATSPCCTSCPAAMVCSC